MKLTSAIQEALLALLCYDDTPKGARFVRTLVEPQAYDSYYRDLAEAASSYLEKYEKPPGEHTLDLIDTLKQRNPESVEIYDSIFRSLEQTRQSINRDYIITQASLFARQQRLKRGITRAIDLLGTGEDVQIDEAENVLRGAIEGSMDLFHPGLYLSDTEKSLAFLDRQVSDALPVGIPEIDKYELGPAPGRMHLFMAPQKRGKSWWLVHLGKMGLLHGMRVLYITLELSEEEVAQRFIQSLFSVSKRQGQVSRQTFDKDDLGRFSGMEALDLGKRPSLRDEDIRTILLGKMKNLKTRPPLIIRQFPTGALTIRELEAYLDSLESHSFMPDLVLVDYADLMDISTKNYRVDVGKTYQQLRGIAVKRKFRLATASQSRRSTLESTKLVTEADAAEDISKISTADSVLTYNQTPAEKTLGLARLYQAVARTDVDKFTVLISQAYALGQFCLESASMVNSYWNHLPSEKDDEDEDDEGDE